MRLSISDTYSNPSHQMENFTKIVREKKNSEKALLKLINKAIKTAELQISELKKLKKDLDKKK
jgi:hypothetical protein